MERSATNDVISKLEEKGMIMFHSLIIPMFTNYFLDLRVLTIIFSQLFPDIF